MLRLLFFLIPVVVFVSTGCQKKSENSEIVISFPTRFSSQNKLVRAQSTSTQAVGDKYVKEIILNVRGQGIAGVISLKKIVCANNNCSNSSSTTSLSVSVPTGSNRIIQLLVLTSDNSSYSDLSDIYYGEVSKDLTAGSQSVSIIIEKAISQKSENRIKGRYITGKFQKTDGTFVESGPTGFVDFYFSPKPGSPSMKVYEAPIFNGWFDFFAIGGRGFTYIVRDSGKVLFENLDLDSMSTSSLSGDSSKVLIEAPDIEAKQYVYGGIGVWLGSAPLEFRPGGRLLLGYFKDQLAPVTDHFVCRDTNDRSFSNNTNDLAINYSVSLKPAGASWLTQDSLGIHWLPTSYLKGASNAGYLTGGTDTIAQCQNVIEFSPSQESLIADSSAFIRSGLNSIGRFEGALATLPYSMNFSNVEAQYIRLSKRFNYGNTTSDQFPSPALPVSILPEMLKVLFIAEGGISKKLVLLDSKRLLKLDPITNQFVEILSNVEDIVVSRVAYPDANWCARLTNGALRCSGQNSDLTGSTTFGDFTSPTPGLALADFSFGEAGACGIEVGSRYLWCWGSDIYGELGNGANTTPGLYHIDGVIRYLQVSSGLKFLCGLTEGGVVKCWGQDSNNDGNLGNGTNSNKDVPTAIAAIDIFTEVAVGTQQACALTDLGNIKCWGYNGLGGLGNGPISNSATPIEIPGATTFSTLRSTAYNFCAVTSSSQVKCWGEGALVNAQQSPLDTPTLIQLSGNAIAQTLKLYEQQACVRTVEGQSCWGNLQYTFNYIKYTSFKIETQPLPDIFYGEGAINGIDYFRKVYSKIDNARWMFKDTYDSEKLNCDGIKTDATFKLFGTITSANYASTGPTELVSTSENMNIGSAVGIIVCPYKLEPNSQNKIYYSYGNTEFIEGY